MHRELPHINIEGTDFIVDVMKVELREKGKEDNVIPIFAMEDVGDGYVFTYDKVSHYYCPSWRPSKGVTVKIPQLVTLDPEGMAQKYGLNSSEIKGKSDLQLMVDQEAFDLRMNKGVLPTIGIAGHTFYVDIARHMLRPKDDFHSGGIPLAEIQSYLDLKSMTYTIPYNPQTHEFEEPDYLTIREFPKNLIAVSFPFEGILDRVGFNRHLGFPITMGLKKNGLHLNFKAKVIPWEKTFLKDVIRINRREEAEKKVLHRKMSLKQIREKGRRM